ncbi:MAG TPA: carboxypeptidase-like regulatory domain-containing protein [Thermoanaerobaculia bacterium]|nr:carboxypeptidase-like regulatory domain-containing protein [Thermoanaerobaculia bacterium]
MRPLRGLVGGLGLALAGAGCLLPAPAFALSTGDPVAISGKVTDTGGHPLGGLRIVLEASRKSLRRGENEVRRVAASTDAGGSYTITWPWDPYFNRFEIQAGVAIRRGKEEKFEVFERQSLSARQLETGAVAVPVIIREGERLAKLRSFETQVQTDDERRVFTELGQPDEVRIVEYPDRREATWWYFEAGRAYRFESGRLVQVIPFDPIRKF